MTDQWAARVQCVLDFISGQRRVNHLRLVWIDLQDLAGSIQDQYRVEGIVLGLQARDFFLE
ncbi:hypothetical protein D3C76_1569150 [compost metagenome]